MRKKILSFLGALLLFTGCASKQDRLDEKIEKIEEVKLQVAKIKSPFLEQQDSKEIFKQFPFISLKPSLEIRGKFSDDFYKSLDTSFKAKHLKDVNFWKLQEDPSSLDFIYVLPLWIKDYRKISKDLLENIAYSYNISKEEQHILRDWIAQGGKLWVEFGTFSTKYDVFNRYGEISTKKIRSLINSSFNNTKLFSKPIRSYIFKSKNLDVINYIPSSKEFTIDTQRSKFKDIKRLKLNLENFMENYAIALGEPLILDTKGRALVTQIPYQEGMVVTLLPFEYKDVYYDGELLRWRLLFYLLGR
ncbi:MAG: hypothetical protein GXO61_00650 [Epsilonproteobacteria bacterium]|nr:hypothetical protein [Campylobacterota bacterium]